MTSVMRHNVTVSGPEGGPVMVFAHGFGCDQNMWRLVAPSFAEDHRVLLFDHAGAGRSDPAAYDPDRHASLQGYADDVLAIMAELEVTDAVFVGHSVSAMVGALAAKAEPERFAQLVMVGPSPRYIDDDDYVGGFSEADIDDLLESLDSNYLGWSSAMAPVIMGNAERPELAEELQASFCRTDPDIASRFAAVTFRSDNREDLASVTIPTLVLQSRDDAIAPMVVGEYVVNALPDARMVVLDVQGHCPHLSAPGQTVAAIHDFVDG